MLFVCVQAWPWFALVSCFLLIWDNFILRQRNRRLALEVENIKAILELRNDGIQNFERFLVHEDERKWRKIRESRAEEVYRLQNYCTKLEEELEIEKRRNRMDVPKELQILNEELTKQIEDLKKKVAVLEVQLKEEIVCLATRTLRILYANFFKGDGDSDFYKTAIAKCSELLELIREVLTCPITKELMDDPCMTYPIGDRSKFAAAHLYDRAALENWKKQHHTEPMTRSNFAIAFSYGHRKLLEMYKKICNDSFWAKLNEIQASSNLGNADVQAFLTLMRA